MSKTAKIIIAVMVVVIVVGGIWYGIKIQQEKNTIKVGWIGALTGPISQYGSYQAGMLAIEDINKSGGINGKKLQLIVEDGKCNANDAVTAMNKLIDVDNVKIVLGGHCTPESMAIAPIAEKNKVIMLASITTSPALQVGDFVFRTSPISVIQSVLVADLAHNQLNKKKMAIVYEQTSYAQPIAQKLKEQFTADGGSVPVYESYVAGTTDFRDILTKVKAADVDSLFLSAQSPDAALNFMKQVKEIGLNVQLFGNDVAGNQSVIDKIPTLYEGFILALPNFDVNSPKTKAFINEYNQKYGTKNLPYGVWTAESYDAEFIVANMIKQCGQTNTDCMKQFLHSVNNYQGVSGSMSIDAKGNGVREYGLKIVKNGVVTNYK